MDGGNLGSPVSVNGSGVATIQDSDLPVSGSPHIITVSYSGDANFGGSSGTLSGGETVTPVALDITANSTSKTYGQTVTLAGTALSAAQDDFFHGLCIGLGVTLEIVAIVALARIRVNHLSSDPSGK